MTAEDNYLIISNWKGHCHSSQVGGGGGQTNRKTVLRKESDSSTSPLYWHGGEEQMLQIKERDQCIIHELELFHILSPDKMF